MIRVHKEKPVHTFLRPEHRLRIFFIIVISRSCTALRLRTKLHTKYKMFTLLTCLFLFVM